MPAVSDVFGSLISELLHGCVQFVKITQNSRLIFDHAVTGVSNLT